MMVPNRPSGYAEETALVPGTAFVGIVEACERSVVSIMLVYERPEGLLRAEDRAGEGGFRYRFVLDGES